MVSCYSIILLSAALFGAMLERVRWYMMCHCSSNLGFSSVEHTVFFAVRAWFSPPGENIAHPLFFSFFYHFFSLFFSVTQCCFIKRATHPGSVLLINIPPGLAVKIINLISLRRELDVSLITARNIKQIKAQSLALHHRKEWRSREFRKLNCWEHSVIYLPHYPGDATFFFFTLFIRKTCLELDVRELLHITVLVDTASLAKKAQQFRGELSSTKLQNVHPCPAGYYFQALKIIAIIIAAQTETQ